MSLSVRLVFATLFISLAVSALADQRDTATYVFPAVTVTATRVSDSLLRVPMAVSIVYLSTLGQQRANGIDHALDGVPGILAQSRYGDRDVRLTIRGYGARGAGERSNAGTSRGVRVMLDGFPLTEPDGRTAFDLVDLSSVNRVEVVRSNSSALWGNAAGGVSNFLSDSEFLTSRAAVHSSMGSFHYQKEVIEAATFVGAGRMFFSLSTTRNGGWRQHSGSERKLINAGLLTPIGAKTSLRVALAATNNEFQIPGPLTRAQFEANPRQAQGDTANYRPTYVDRDERRHNRQGRLGISLEHEFDSAHALATMLFVEPKYLQRSECNTFRDFTRYHIGGNITAKKSARLSATVKSLFLAGVDEAYQDGAILFYNLVEGQRGSELRDNKREGANSFGAFIQNEFDIGDRLGITVGARYDKLTYYSDNYINPLLDARKSFEQITPKGGVNYRLSKDRSLYFNIGGGIEIPAGNETDPPSTSGEDTVTAINPLLEAIESTSLEVGSKGMIVCNHGWLEAFSYDVALYRIDISNDIIPYRGGRFYFTAGKTRRTGIEVGTSVRMSAGFSVSGSLTISDNKYVEYVVDSVHYGRADQIADYSDNEQAGIPEVFYRVSLRYSPRPLRWIIAEIGAQGVGQYYAEDANEVEVESYDAFDVSVQIARLPLAKDWLYLNGGIALENVFDRTYAASAFINPDLDQSKRFPIYLEPGLPRNWTCSIALEWAIR